MTLTAAFAATRGFVVADGRSSPSIGNVSRPNSAPGRVSIGRWLRGPLRLGLLLLLGLVIGVAGFVSQTRVDSEPRASVVDDDDSTGLLVVRPGQAISWTNGGHQSHRITARDGTFDSGVLVAGGTWTHQFATAGAYPFFCTLHPALSGGVLVDSREQRETLRGPEVERRGSRSD